MPVLIFPYSPDAYVDPETQQLGYLYRPYVPVRLDHKGIELQFRIDALLDSGADHNLFPAYLGEQLGIEVRQGPVIDHGGIGDSFLRAYRHVVKVVLNGYTFETRVDFSYDHHLPLLGREDFFDHFDEVLFRQREQQVVLRY